MTTLSRFVSTIVALAALPQLLMATCDPPPQVVSMIANGNFPTGYNIHMTYRMANNGLEGELARLTTRFVNVPEPELEPFRAYVFDYDTGFPGVFRHCPLYSDTAFISARCGNYGGFIGGELDGNQSSIDKPAYWFSTTSDPTGPNQVDNNNNSGLFWDVTGVVNSDCYFAGFYFDGTDKHAVRVQKSNNVKFSPSEGNYDGSEARGINKDLDLCGQAFGSSQSPPVIWMWSGSTYTMLDLSDTGVCPDWPTGRSGYLVGITDRDSGYPNSDGPYAVGYMEPGGGDDSNARTFIYSVGSKKLRLLDYQFGVPEPMSNRGYDVNDPVIAFCGTGPMPYVWLGSPDPDATNFGCPVDIWAFFDPDVTQRLDTLATTVTGINRDFRFGGSQFPGTGQSNANVWMASSESDSAWTVASGTPSYSMTTGSVSSGSLTSLAALDGQFVTCLRGVVLGGNSRIVIQADQELGQNVPQNALAFRATAKANASANFTLKVELYNWTASTWTELSRASVYTAMRTSVGKLVEDEFHHIADYVDENNNNRVRARIWFELTSSHNIWGASFEQGVFLGK